jgi:(1->4)-alpha-D-glucan 1-alpha-D-glucosylmutase
MIPRATYRLQFREGMTFDAAARLVPYLAGLGISHLYASPIFSAASDSAHGYDVVDHGCLDPELGGEAGFARLDAILKHHGMGLILDIVPNHMAASIENPWWVDVLKWGSASRFARHFDIDWSASKLLLPVLGEPYGEALEKEQIQGADRRRHGRTASGLP